MEQTTTIKYVNDASDSLEIGTPAKGGVIKVYGNANDRDSFRNKIDSMIALRQYANDRLYANDKIIGVVNE